MTAVVVAYATRNGSTREVAAAVADALRENGCAVELLPAADRRLLPVVDLVVLGAPLYSGRWHRSAHRFLKRHRRELERLPVAVFGMGPREDTPESWQRARAQLDRALARRTWLRPVAVAVFGGVDPPGKAAQRDLRDWARIRAWAAALAPLGAR